MRFGVPFCVFLCAEFEFVALCLRRCVLPAMADWLSLLRSSPPASDEELAGLANFKLGCGLLCELAVLLLSPSTPLPVEEKVRPFLFSFLLFCCFNSKPNSWPEE